MHSAIAVTGSAGRLGHALVARLAEDARIASIVALELAFEMDIDIDNKGGIDRRASTRATGPHSAGPTIEYARCDRDSDPGELADRLRGCGAVVHMAGPYGSGAADPDGPGAGPGIHAAIAAHLEALDSALAAALSAGVSHFVYVSSIAVYARSEGAGPLGEDAPLAVEPVCFRGRVCAAAERRLDELEAAHPELCITRVRASLYAADSDRDALGLLAGPWLLLPGRALTAAPLCIAHLTHVDDVAEALYQALARGARGAFNVAADMEPGGPLTAGDVSRQLGARQPSLPAPVPTAMAMGTAMGAVHGLYTRLRAHARTGQAAAEQPARMPLGAAVAAVHVSTREARRALGWRPVCESTGTTLRAIAGRPTAAASPGTRLLLGLVCGLTRVRGHLPSSAWQERELGSVHGDANLLLTGAHPSEWHLSFQRGLVGMHPGLARRARARVRMSEAVFVQIIEGTLTWSSATMTGKIRLSGDADFGLLVGGVLAGLRQLLAGPGLAARALSRLVHAAGFAKDIHS